MDDGKRAERILEDVEVAGLVGAGEFTDDVLQRTPHDPCCEYAVGCACGLTDGMDVLPVVRGTPAGEGHPELVGDVGLVGLSEPGAWATQNLGRCEKAAQQRAAGARGSADQVADGVAHPRRVELRSTRTLV